jgi:type II secretory pathway pseudopilin PulG
MNLPAANPISIRSPQHRRDQARCRPAFTLTELLIVIGIIVLFVTMALPAFNLISGGKSIAGAENEISALLGRARAEAIGVQDYRGVLIYRDAATDRYCGAVVAPVMPSFAAYPSWNNSSAYQQYNYVQYTPTPPGNITHYYVCQSYVPPSSTGSNPAPPNGSWSECAPNAMDIEGNGDVQAFPAGVGVQVINNCGMNTNNTRASNGYLPIGVIMFDGTGTMKLVPQVTIAGLGSLGTIGNFSVYTQSWISSAANSIPYYGAQASGTPHTGLNLSSSFGLVVFDKATFEGQGFSSTQLPSQLSSSASSTSTTNTGYISGEQSIDTWLDANATPLLINRYNGTLVRSE